MNIPFNKPFFTGKELEYIEDAVSSGKISGNGKYTRQCQELIAKRYGFNHCLLTTSCTDALEMAAILLNVQPGDEVIMPSFTFVSMANAFVLRGATVRFTDSRADHPGIDESKIEELINEKTKALVIVHYAGVACDMEKIMNIAHRNNIYVVEDAAHSIDSYFTSEDGSSKPLGTMGHLAAFSFHETKNIICGEGGMLVVNDEQFIERSEIIWEKGTNRSAFFRGEVDKYTWIDIGSSFLPSELNAAFLFAQMEHIDEIQEKRLSIWKRYDIGLKDICESLQLKQPIIPSYANNNGHMYYLICKSNKQRDKFIAFLKDKGIHSVFHYLPLHKSEFYRSQHDGRNLKQAKNYADCLVRLPFFYELTVGEQDYIIQTIQSYGKHS